MSEAHDTHEDLLTRLESEGHRLTGPRRAVVEALTERHEGFTVEELHHAVRGVGRATIYRTVRLLVETGIVCKLSGFDGKPLYSLAHAGHHHHAVCLRCGTVLDVYRCGVDNLLENIELATGSRVMGHKLEVYVLCPDCISREHQAAS